MIKSAYNKETDKSYGIFRRNWIDDSGRCAFIVEVVTDCSGKGKKTKVAEIPYYPLAFNSTPALNEAVRIGRASID